MKNFEKMLAQVKVHLYNAQLLVTTRHVAQLVQSTTLTWWGRWFESNRAYQYIAGNPMAFRTTTTSISASLWSLGKLLQNYCVNAKSAALAAFFFARSFCPHPQPPRKRGWLMQPGEQTCLTFRCPMVPSRSFEQPVTVAGVAASIGAGLARATLAGKVDGKLVDASHLIEHNADLVIVTERDADGLDIIRHSSAHLLAHAVDDAVPRCASDHRPDHRKRLLLRFQLQAPVHPRTIWPPSKENGRAGQADIPVERYELPRDEAIAYFKSIGRATRPRSSNPSRRASAQPVPSG